MAVNQSRVLTLHGGENNEFKLYRLEKGWTLRFVLGPSLHASPVRVFSNHPQDKHTKYDRDTYYEVYWKNYTGSKIDRYDVVADVHIYIAGSFNYYFTVDDRDSRKSPSGQGYFLVDPTLSYGAGDDEEDEITMDCIQCQSVITKLLGPFPEWEQKLYAAKMSGYNMIHFTPLQELGESNSAYSIRDQRHLSPVYNTGGKQYTYKDVNQLVQKMCKEWKVLSLTDLVFNHTATDTPWIVDHPECVYNLKNSPHLKPAYLVDRIFYHFNVEVADGKWKHRGIPIEITTEEHLKIIYEVLSKEVFPMQKLHEFYSIDVEECLKQFKYAIEENRFISSSRPVLEIIQDKEFRRNKCSIDLDTALRLYNTDRPGVQSRQERIDVCSKVLRHRLDELATEKENMVINHIGKALENFIANARYRYVTGDGPKLGKVTAKEPLMFNYFVQPTSHQGTLDFEEGTMYGDGAAHIMAVNGWVMGDDPLKNFAEPGRDVYLRRELIAWGDSVKLRFGEKPEDCPFLWDLMKNYAETTARIFHGVRLDNCHSTPLHVAAYMIDAARKVRPDLYVVAELFTGHEDLDNIFMNKLGINSLIRESLNAGNANEQGRLIHRYGGHSVGSFNQPRLRPLLPTTAHALLFDQTHDNKSPIELRSPYDSFPSAALVCMACCAVGSNRGYDQLVPKHINVVTEERKYMAWTTDESPARPFMNKNFGITAGKKILNELHFKLGYEKYSEVYVDNLRDDVVAVTRHNPNNHDSVVLVARTAFQHPQDPHGTGYIKPIVVQGRVKEVLFEGRVLEAKEFTYVKDSEYINGLPNYYLEMRQNFDPKETKMVDITLSESGETTQISFKQFTPGSVVIIQCGLSNAASKAILKIRQFCGQFGYLMRSYSGHKTYDESWDTTNFQAIVGKLSLTDLNHVLYRCDAEEQSDGNGFGAYDVPGHGPFVYCGIRGIVAVLNEMRERNDLGHAVCGNLREGNWLPQYIANRLKVKEGTKVLGQWFDEVFKHLSNVPRSLVPCYFDTIIMGSFIVLRGRVVEQMSDFIKDGSTFLKILAMGAVQFCGYVKTSKLPPLSPNLSSPKPPVDEDDKEATLSLAAGFSHFGAGYMRNWGRDTFISLRGLLLVTGRYQEARFIILAYGGCLRHGLIPNLLNEGKGARFNCRDAVWWWLQAIQDYCQIVPDGTSILKDKVHRLYPSDSPEVQEPGSFDQPLHDVMQEALQRHAEGLKYREFKAGPEIDSQMIDPGFNNEIGVTWENGFVFGGNEWNCGTWMDKMGSSDKAGNKGKPATPRNGSAVELVGLSKSALRWLQEMKAKDKYPYDSVNARINGADIKVTFEEWEEKIQSNFEEFFWINSEPMPDKEPHPELINKRGIYKDSYFAKPFFADFQLRPNFFVAMAVAPELFTPENAWTALKQAQDILVGPLGVKTLDPSDWSYVADYDNSNDSNDPKVAHGFNYHNGPEWVWLMGYFLRAKLIFADKLEKRIPGIRKQTMGYIKSKMTVHFEHLTGSPWQSLPELTNSHGSYCRDSCAAQAWSVGCLLEVFYDLNQVEEEDDLAKSAVRPKDKHDVLVSVS
ncbi:glycogen debranching enzyme-like [Mytilus trossulus]|uniref:glycogen debranching enzyme-like n=1 Tax=Mytilus trossulus TaxID=6551 RepID=UPI003007684A